MYGSVRSGKTEIQQYCALKAVKNLPPGNIQFIGKTIGALQRNFIIPLQQKFPGHVFYNRSTKTVRIFGRECWVEGATNEGAIERIQGESLVAAFGDEVVTWPQNFFEMLDTRLSDSGSVFIGSMNPGSPNHYIKKLIDREDELGLALDGRKELRSWRFILDENAFLDPSYIASLKKKYPKGSVLYRRFIGGLWVAAEGRVYPFFDELPEAGYVVDRVPDNFIMYLVGLDYGTSNPFSAQLWGLSGGVWYCLKEVHWDSMKQGGKQKTNPEYVEEIKRLCFWNDRPIAPQKILVPPEEPGFQKDLVNSGTPELRHVADANNKIMPGVEDLTTLLSLGKLKIFHKCENAIYGFNELRWDEKKQQQGIDMYIKGGSGAPDHPNDASRYIGREAKRILMRMGMLL
jgi:PBSX family phage terminase large subunit